MLKLSIEKLIRQENLDSETCQRIFDEMLQGDINSVQTAAVLALLRAKGETVEELVGMATGLKQRMIPVVTKHSVLDIVGTGGDGANTVNISTGSAILAASCGVKVAKHGSRAASSMAGSADVLEKLNINIDLTPEQVSASIEEVGIGFCFAPNFHPSMLALRILRKQLNIPTAFNLLGPLLNPTNPAHVVLGVFDESLLRLIAESLQQLGTKRSVIVHGCGLDEISTLGSAKIIEVTPDKISEFFIHPEQLGFEGCALEDLQGGDAEINAQLLLTAFSGRRGAIADTLILNAAMGLYIAGLHTSIEAAVAHASENLYDQSALKLLKKWQEFSHDQ